MLARLPLRSKLILVVSVPLFVILGFAGFGIASRLGDLEGQRQYGWLRLPIEVLTAAQRAVEDEGVLSTWYVAAAGAPAVEADLDRAREATDRASAAVDVAGRGLSAGDVSAGTRRAWNQLEDRLDGLDALRRQADELAGLPAAFADRYAGITDATIDVSVRLARDVDDRLLSDSMLGIVSLRRAQAAAADEAMIVIPFLVTGTSTQLTDWFTAIVDRDDGADAFRVGASADERAAFARAVRRAPDDPFRRAAGSTPTAFPRVAITPDEYYANWQDRQVASTAAIGGVQRVVDSTAATLEADALRAVLGYGLGISVLVLLVLVLAWVMIRSVNRTLRSLTDAARDVAENQLPHLVDTLQRGEAAAHIDPIPPLTVESKDEIGALAQAFNTIQQTTVRVAEEQSALLRKGIGDLYVNLARRNQSLVDRQIALLDVLEAQAEDPDQLGSLFELDHLATRMRRNAESLLVLSGAGQSRQWSEAIPILDVVRAASGEIADFARVSAVGFEGDIAVTGNAVADVTHILAELLENATAFSPPGSPVVVAGMLAEQRFVVSITDEGIGMDEDRLAAANALLQRPPPPGLSLSRTLGLHVVAHLAVRYGLRVQLRRSATNGVTAIVALPATVLTRLVPASTAAPPPAPAPAPAFAFVAPPPVAEPVASWSPPVTVAAEPPFAAFDPAPPSLPRRVPGGSPPGTDPTRDALPRRDPGNHLSPPPAAPAAASGAADARPRPERVHDLLTHHLRGIRDGRLDDATSVAGDRTDAEDLL